MADVNRKLAEAVRKGSLKGVVDALNAGADPNTTYDFSPHLPRDMTVLMMAAGRPQNNPEIAEVLITNGADVNATNQGGYTALHYAVGHPNVEVLRQLIAAKANLNTRDATFGMTPLHSASMQSRPLELLEMLLEAGADMEVKDNRGRTPFTYALERYHAALETQQGLRFLGGNPPPPAVDNLALLIEAGATVTPEQLVELPAVLQQMASAKKRDPMLQMRDYLLNRAPEAERGGRKTRKRTRKTKRRV